MEAERVKGVFVADRPVHAFRDFTPSPRDDMRRAGFDPRRRRGRLADVDPARYESEEAPTPAP